MQPHTLNYYCVALNHAYNVFYLINLIQNIHLNYLFILCVEGLSSLISKVVQHKVICGIKISPRAPETSHLLFTDDNIIFGRATVEEATFLSHILKFYQKAFDQVINFDKIGLSWSHNVQSTRINTLKRNFEVRALKSHQLFKSTHFSRKFWKKKLPVCQAPSLEKMKGWKEKKFSRASFEVPIKAVVLSIPSYAMGFFFSQFPYAKRLKARRQGSSGVAMLMEKVCTSWAGQIW